MFIALIFGDVSDSTSESSIELTASGVDFIQTERIDPRLFVISESAGKLYVYNMVISLTKIRPVNKIREKVWALPDESSQPAHTVP
jgi:hypothetical protein